MTSAKRLGLVTSELEARSLGGPSIGWTPGSGEVKCDSGRISKWLPHGRSTSCGCVVAYVADSTGMRVGLALYKCTSLLVPQSAEVFSTRDGGSASADD